jgi:hypothetical protein
MEHNFITKLIYLWSNLKKAKKFPFRRGINKYIGFTFCSFDYTDRLSSD